MFAARAAAVALVVAATLAVAGCTFIDPPMPSPTESATLPQPQPTQSNQLQFAFRIPLPQKGDVARLVEGPPDSLVGQTVAVPATKYGYDVIFSCVAADPTTRFGWEIDDANSPRTKIVASSVDCDGSVNENTAIPAGASVPMINFHLTGDFTGNDAYAILTPALSAAAPTN